MCGFEVADCDHWGRQGTQCGQTADSRLSKLKMFKHEGLWESRAWTWGRGRGPRQEVRA